MTAQLSGVGGYASLMRTQKNPFDRNIATTGQVLASMPKDGGVSGLEGLGKLPLMYMQGADTASAQQFDEQKAAEENQMVQGVLGYQRQQDKAKLDLETAKANAEIKHKESQSLQETLKTASELAKGGQEGEAVKLLNKAGVPVQNFKVVPNGFQAQGKDGKFYQLAPDENGQFIPWVFDGKSWVKQSEADIEGANTINDAPTSVKVHDPNSKTGFSNVTQKGNLIQDTLTPTEMHPKTPKEPKLVDYSVEMQKWNRTLAPQFTNLGRFLTSKQEDFAAAPDEASKVRILLTPGALTPEGQKEYQKLNALKQAGEDHIVNGGTASSAVQSILGRKNSTQAPMTATNPQTGERIESTDGGKTWKPKR